MSQGIKRPKNYNDLMDKLSQYGTWWDVDNETNEKAKKTLISFYQDLKRIKIQTSTGVGLAPYTFYIHHLLEIRKAFEEKKYARVSNELQNLLHDGLLV